MQIETIPPQGKGVDDGALTDDEEADKRILGSHIDIKVDPDAYNASDEEGSSPRFPSSATRSHSSLMEDSDSPLSPNYRTKRYGFALPPGVTYDLHDEDDDSEGYPEIYDWTSSPLFRGRSLTRKQLTSFEIYGVSPTGRDGSSRDKARASLRTLRSISANLRPGSAMKNETKAVEKDTSRVDNSKGLLRGLRSRKSSPLVTQSIEVNQAVESPCTGSYDALEPERTKKSGLKGWAKFMIPDRKRKKHDALRERKSQARSRAPSPTGSWARTQGDQHEERPILPKHSEYKADEGSVTSLTDEKEVEKEQAPAATNMTISNAAKVLEEQPAPAFKSQSMEMNGHQEASEATPATTTDSPEVPTEVLVASIPLPMETKEDQEDLEEKTVVDITMPQHRPTFAAENIFELPAHAAHYEIKTTEDQVPGEAGSTQKEAPPSIPPVTTRSGAEEWLKDKGPVIVQETSSEQATGLNEVVPTKSYDKSPLSPQSTFMQNIIESRNVRPHPPRKSSLRRLVSINRSGSGIPKYSFPLPRIESEAKWEQDEGERSLLSETKGHSVQ